MAVRDDPESCIKAADAKAIMDRHGAQGVMIFMIRADGVIDSATYGKDAQACRFVDEWRNGVADTTLSVVPFQTYFGWGNDGAPKALTAKELASLTLGQRNWALARHHPSVRPTGAELEAIQSTTQYQEVADKVRSIVWTGVEMFDEIRALYPNADAITLDTKFVDDLKADSLDYVTMAIAIEDVFDIDIDDEAISSVVTVGDLVDHILKVMWR